MFGKEKPKPDLNLGSDRVEERISNVLNDQIPTRIDKGESPFREKNYNSGLLHKLGHR